MTPYAEQADGVGGLNQWGLAFQLYDDLADQMADSYRGATNYANFFGQSAACDMAAHCLAEVKNWLQYQLL